MPRPRRIAVSHSTRQRSLGDVVRLKMQHLTVVQLTAFAAPSALLFLFRAASYVIPARYAARFGFGLAAFVE